MSSTSGIRLSNVLDGVVMLVLPYKNRGTIEDVRRASMADISMEITDLTKALIINECFQEYLEVHEGAFANVRLLSDISDSGEYKRSYIFITGSKNESCEMVHAACAGLFAQRECGGAVTVKRITPQFKVVGEEKVRALRDGERLQFAEGQSPRILPRQEDEKAS